MGLVWGGRPQLLTTIQLRIWNISAFWLAPDNATQEKKSHFPTTVALSKEECTNLDISSVLGELFIHIYFHISFSASNS